MTIKFMTGDATAPTMAGHKLIVHVCNDLGRWGKGFVLAISKRWPGPEQEYRRAFASPNPPQLGEVQFVHVAHDLTVANLIGQHGIQSRNSKNAVPPIRYDAIKQGLALIAEYATKHNASVHMPRVGCGLAGGKWEQVEPIVQQELATAGIEVVVYDFA